MFRRAHLARALVIAAWISVIVSAQAGAEGLDVPLREVIVSDNVLFHFHTTLLASLYTTKSAMFAVGPNEFHFYFFFTASLSGDKELRVHHQEKI